MKDNLGHEEVESFASGAVRSSTVGKMRWDLVPWEAMQEVTRVYTWGATKYADRNWEKGIPLSRMFASMMRHVIAYFMGEDVDPESGIHHMAHAVWNGLGILEFALRGRADLDDRPIQKKKEPEPPAPEVSGDWRGFPFTVRVYGTGEIVAGAMTVGEATALASEMARSHPGAAYVVRD